MTFLRRIAGRPGLPVAIAVALCVVLLERSAGRIALGLVGLALGTLVAIAVLQLGLLVGAVLTGVRVHRVVLGVGRRVREWRSPRHALVLRAVPLSLSVAVGPGRAPVRLRLWLAAFISALTLLTLTALLAIGSRDAVWRGGALAGLAVLGHALLPRSDASSTSTGWLLLRLPRLPEHKIAELEAAPLVDRALAEVNAGRLAAAQAVADELAGAHPDLRATRAVLASVLEARGRYGEALTHALTMVSDPQQSERDMALALAGLAGLAAAAVEAGQLDPLMGLDTARRATADAQQLHFPAAKLAGTRALIALLEGDTGRAVGLARLAAEGTDHGLSRADELATLARAHMAGGDNRAARAVLAEAEALAPWWPRVAATRARLEIG